MSKGDNPRPVDKERYDRNYERIFHEPNPAEFDRWEDERQDERERREAERDEE